MHAIPDNILIQDITENNCNNSLVELASRHAPLFYSVVNRYSAQLMYSGQCLNDIYNEKLNVIYLSACSYKSGRSKFSTWLANQTRFFCLKLINKKHKTINLQDLDWAKIPDSSIKNFDSQNYLNDLIGQIQDKRIQTIFQLRYFSGKKGNWTKIGKKVNLSRQQAINLHDKTIKLLKSKLTSKVICDIV